MKIYIENVTDSCIETNIEDIAETYTERSTVICSETYNGSGTETCNEPQQTERNKRRSLKTYKQISPQLIGDVKIHKKLQIVLGIKESVGSQTQENGIGTTETKALDPVRKE